MKYILATAMVVFLSACIGTPVNWDAARSVQLGMSEGELINTMGAPTLVSSKGDTKVLVWRNANGFTGSSNMVTFGVRDGKVIAVPSVPISFK